MSCGRPTSSPLTFTESHTAGAELALVAAEAVAAQVGERPAERELRQRVVLDLGDVGDAGAGLDRVLQLGVLGRAGARVDQVDLDLRVLLLEGRDDVCLSAAPRPTR